jgi:hypothetical protein
VAKEKLTRYTTPKGVAVFPHLHAPDTKFDADGVYKLGIRLDADTAEAVMDAIRAELPKAQAKLDEALSKEKAANKRKDYSLNDEPWSVDDDGNVTFNVKMNARVTSKKDGKTYDLRPQLFDAKGRPIKFGTRIGGGSTVRVALELVPYFMASTKTAGISLRLVAVQVIELRTFSADAGAFGFGAEEGFDSTEGGAEMFGDGDEDTSSTDDAADDAADAADDDDF